MLRQVYIFKNDLIIYSLQYAKVLNEANFKYLVPDLIRDAFSSFRNDIIAFNYHKYKIIFTIEFDLNLIFIFISDLSDDSNRLQTELLKLKKEFSNLFGESIEKVQDYSVLDVLHSFIDSIHRNLKPKISLVGFS
ncbi:MAG: hypothetical protein ACFFHD_01960 [Promethearchaeota archaeon]